MANISSKSLANQLAKAATGGLEAGAERVKSNPLGNGWQIADLDGFALDEALGQAYGKAAGYLNFMLSPEGLVVNLQQGGEQTTAAVLEAGGGRLYRTYAGPDMLKLYANQYGGRGVVADGQV